MKKPKFDGPIPGENFTSDTRNYPWHRPPDKSDYVEIVEAVVSSLKNPEYASVALTALEDGETITDFVTGAIRLGVSSGKIPIDQGILAAGPLAKMLETIAKQAGIEYERGFDIKPRILTKAKADFYRGRGTMDEKPTEPVEEATPAPAKGGLMGKPVSDPKAEQDAMLGRGEQ